MYYVFLFVKNKFALSYFPSQAWFTDEPIVDVLTPSLIEWNANTRLWCPSARRGMSDRHLFAFSRCVPICMCHFSSLRCPQCRYRVEATMPLTATQ